MTKDIYEDGAKVSKGLKLNNDKSYISAKNEDIKNADDTFRKEAHNLILEQQDKNKKMLELVKSFLYFVNDSTLSENKSPIIKEVESSTRTELTKLALDLDNDESISTMGIGSMAVSQALLKACFVLRDKLNSSLYENSLLSNELIVVNKNIKEMKAQIKFVSDTVRINNAVY
jgi:hypothetical protein